MRNQKHTPLRSPNSSVQSTDGNVNCDIVQQAKEKSDSGDVEPLLSGLSGEQHSSYVVGRTMDQLNGGPPLSNGHTIQHTSFNYSIHSDSVKPRTSVARTITRSGNKLQQPLYFVSQQRYSKSFNDLLLHQEDAYTDWEEADVVNDYSDIGDAATCEDEQVAGTFIRRHASRQKAKIARSVEQVDAQGNYFPRKDVKIYTRDGGVSAPEHDKEARRRRQSQSKDSSVNNKRTDNSTDALVEHKQIGNKEKLEKGVNNLEHVNKVDNRFAFGLGEKKADNLIGEAPSVKPPRKAKAISLLRRKDQKRKEYQRKHMKLQKQHRGFNELTRRKQMETSGDSQGRRSELRQLCAACHVESYNLKRLYDALIQKRQYAIFMDKEQSILTFEVPDHFFSVSQKVEERGGHTLHRARSADAVPMLIHCTQEEDESGKVDTQKTWCFVFEKAGAAVVWGPSDSDFSDERIPAPNPMTVAASSSPSYMSEILFFLSQFAEIHLRPDWATKENMHYCYILAMRHPEIAPSSRIKLDTVYLETSLLSEKLAASFAIAQSMKLDVFENAVMSSIKRVEEIPRSMATKEAVIGVREGYNSDKNVELRKQIAQLYCRIIDVNICHDLLDVPEYFWHDDVWQHLWKTAHTYLEIEKRIGLLNRRYLFIQELLDVVNDIRQNAQENRLTLVIIWLLAIQCLCIFLRSCLYVPRHVRDFAS